MTYKLLLDTNALLDFMVSERPESNAAVEVVRQCLGTEARGIVCSGSLKDLYYVGKKYLGEQAARDFTSIFLNAFEVFPLDKALCKTALELNEPDFEDGLVRAAAEEVGADFIITRDVEAFQSSTVRAISPARYVELFGTEDR